MKRILRSILIALLALPVIAALPSCRSHKSHGKENYDRQIEQLRTGGRHKHGDSHKDALGMKKRKQIVDEAMSWMGTPYAYGKAEKGKASDCSGMVMSVYEKMTGIKLPRNSAQQQAFCTVLRKSEVLPGDLVFFATGKDPDKVSHVGIMIDGDRFVHASTSKGVVVSDATQPYYQRTFKGFGRVPE